MAQREFHLTLNDEDQLNDIMQALGTPVRRKIMALLRSSCFSVAELAKRLKLPISTVSFHLNILHKAGLISVTVKKNSRGNAKIISRQIDSLSLDFLVGAHTERNNHFAMEIPLGSFTDACVEAGCGMASETEIIISDDLPGAFFSPLRQSAQIIWFSKGYLEYRVPNYMLKNKQVKAVMFSMEICSEAPNYRNDWESDITFWVNGVELATYLSPGDFGGRRGRLNPDWWSDFSTQYGIMKTLRITQKCVFLDETPVQTYTIEKLGLQQGDFITLRIGVKKDARHQGGVNLFGERFGDFSQGLVYAVEYNG